MGKKGKIRLSLIVLLCLAGALLIALGVERSLLPRKPQPAVVQETPIVTLPPSPDKKVVYLDKSPGWMILIDKRNAESILVKELFRQAFLLSAREEAGLLTRDAWLGDAMPDDGPDEPINIVTYPGHPNKLTIELGINAGQKKIALVELETYTNITYKDLLEKTEELSRSKFPAALKNGGYIIASKKPQSEEKIPPEIEKLLGEMNFISQYSAVRQLHELIRSHGESALLLGGLVRGYANLGLLNDYNWHPAFKVFYARSLLYAQRMVVQGKQPRWAKWHRAYAFALCGIQKFALKDLEDAEKEGQVSSAEKDAGGYAKPDWVEIINSFCRFDAKALKPDWDGGENSELKGLLQSVANELAMNGDLIITKALEMLEQSPECYRLYHVVCRFGGVSVGHSGTTECFQVFREKSYRRLGKIPGMLEAVKRVIGNGSPGQGTLSTLVAPYDEDPTSEFLMRRVLIAALFAASDRPKPGQNAATGNAALSDGGEPSWATLGMLIREMSFTQVWRRIYFEANMLSVAPDDSLKEFKPLYADHPYGEYLDAYSWDESTKKQAAEKVQAMPMDGVTFQSFPLFEQYKRLNLAFTQQAAYTASIHMDLISDDLVRSLVCRQRSQKMEPAVYKSYAHDINDISPWSPFGGSLLIDNDWENASKDLKKWEELAAWHPGLMRVIAQRYMKDNHNDDAERCLKVAISVSPDKDSFQMLANIYYDRGEKKKYVSTLEEYLNYPDYHLNHGKICEQIADYYMEDRKWHKALPYAERAAETYSGWGLLCQANCCEAMRDWEQAEQLHRAVAIRYRNSVLTWYLYCKRSGMGDVEAARKVALPYAENPALGDLFWGACFFLLDKQPEKAIPLLQRSTYSWDKLLLFTAADRINDYVTRDAAMQAILEMGKAGPNGKADLPPRETIAIIEMIAADLTNKQSKIDLKAAETLIEKNEPTTQMMFYYYLGKYLDVHGREADAIVFWKKCIGCWKPIDKFARTLAAAELREHGIKQKDIEAALPVENTADEVEKTDEFQKNQEQPQVQE